MAEHPFTNLSPADAAVALRSFGRRFSDGGKAAVATLDDEPDQAEIDEMASRPGADGHSAIDHVASARERLAAAHRTLRVALVSPGHRIDSATLATTMTAPGEHTGRLDVEIDSLDRTAAALADEVDAADASGWLSTRPTSDGDTSSPLEVLQATVAYVLDRLRSLEKVLREVRGRP